MPENGSHQNSAKLLKNSSKTPHPHPPGWREEFRENCLFSCVKRKLLTNSSPQTPHKLLTNSSQTPRPFLVQIRPKLRKKIEAKSRIGNNFYGKRRFFKKTIARGSWLRSWHGTVRWVCLPFGVWLTNGQNKVLTKHRTKGNEHSSEGQRLFI